MEVCGPVNSGVATKLDDGLLMYFHYMIKPALACLLLSAMISAQLPSVATFLRSPQFYSPSLSPDGKFVAALAVNGDKTTLITYERETQQVNRLS